MTHTKPFYLSKTFWSALLAFLLAMAEVFGIGLTTEDAVILSEQVDAILTAVLAIGAIYGRAVAERRLTLT